MERSGGAMTVTCGAWKWEWAWNKKGFSYALYVSDGYRFVRDWKLKKVKRREGR